MKKNYSEKFFKSAIYPTEKPKNGSLEKAPIQEHSKRRPFSRKPSAAHLPFNRKKPQCSTKPQENSLIQPNNYAALLEKSKRMTFVSSKSQLGLNRSNCSANLASLSNSLTISQINRSQNVSQGIFDNIMTDSLLSSKQHSENSLLQSEMLIDESDQIPFVEQQFVRKRDKQRDFIDKKNALESDVNQVANKRHEQFQKKQIIRRKTIASIGSNSRTPKLNKQKVSTESEQSSTYTYAYTRSNKRDVNKTHKMSKSTFNLKTSHFKDKTREQYEQSSTVKQAEKTKVGQTSYNESSQLLALSSVNHIPSATGLNVTGIEKKVKFNEKSHKNHNKIFERCRKKSSNGSKQNSLKKSNSSNSLIRNKRKYEDQKSNDSDFQKQFLVDQLKQKIQILTEEIHAKNDHIVDLERKLKSSQKQNKELHEQVNQIQKKLAAFSGFEEVNKILEEKIMILQEQCSKLKDNYSKSLQEIKYLNVQNTTLKKFKAQNQGMERKCQLLASERNDLREKLSALKAANHNVTSYKNYPSTGKNTKSQQKPSQVRSTPTFKGINLSGKKTTLTSREQNISDNELEQDDLISLRNFKKKQNGVKFYGDIKGYGFSGESSESQDLISLSSQSNF